MRFMVDECVGNKVATWLHTNGHEIYSIYAEARGIQDNDIIYNSRGQTIRPFAHPTKLRLH